MNRSSNYIWSIVASITWGMAYALDEKILTTSSPVHVSIMNAVISLIILIPLALFGNHGSLSDLVHNKNLPLMVLSSILISVAGLFILYGIKSLGAASASIIEISYPFFVVLFTVLLWGERLTTSFVIGGMLMFFGSLIVIRGRI